MGFYHPATLVKDAQRHGQHFLPVDIHRSSWPCTIESNAVRLGFNYVRGLRQETAEALIAARPFTSMVDLVHRTRGLRSDFSKAELRMLAEIGALNSLGGHRRDALWEAERALRPAGPLFENLDEPRESSPLQQMSPTERIRADFYGTGLTIGVHPMSLHRESLRTRGILSAVNLKRAKRGSTVQVAGCVICRQRPGTAKGFLFLSLEDETGIANAIVEPDLFDQNREVLTTAPYLLIEGLLQNQQGAISIKLRRAERLNFATAKVPSHDFH